VAFLILHAISYVFFTGQFNVSCPKIFDILGASFLGCLAGYLVWSFVILLICITPISQQPIVKKMGLHTQLEQANVPYICWWSNFVNKVVSSEEDRVTCKDAVNQLIEDAKEKATPKPVKEPADPNEPAEPNDIENECEAKATGST